MAAVPTMQPARPELPQLRKRPDDAHHSGFGPSPEAGGFISISVDNSERAGRDVEAEHSGGGEVKAPDLR